MEKDTFRLIVRRGPQPNQVYELSSDVMNLGRDITNDIVINDREVSRHHLRFTQGEQGITLEDLGSTNGTFINGKRLTGAQSLHNGDMVGLGETVTLQYEIVRAGAAAPSSSPASTASDDERFRPQAQADAAPPPAAVDPYQPPQHDPYQAPQSAYQAPPAQVDPARQQPSAAYQGADAYAPPQDYYNNQAPNYGPPPPGYDYDPYAVREDEGTSLLQWFAIGCLVIIFLCCCITVLGAVAVDNYCLYDSVPFLTDFLEAVSYPPNCTP